MRYASVFHSLVVLFWNSFGAARTECHGKATHRAGSAESDNAIGAIFTLTLIPT